MTHEEALKDQTRTALDLLKKYHTSVAGTIIADEYISDRNPSHGSELCISAEIMFSTSYIYQYLGDSGIADWSERIAFNAFPASVSSDWWSHQYLQQENQVGLFRGRIHRIRADLSFSVAVVTEFDFCWQGRVGKSSVMG